MDKKSPRPPLFHVIIGTGFGAGFWPWGPGTAGSVLATAIWWVAFQQLGDIVMVLLLVPIFVFTILGTWSTARLQPYWGDDPSRVVVDEMVGVWITLMAAENWWQGLLALLLFRLFDIVKPFGIRQIDRCKGAFWVMFDDIVAGIYAAFTLTAIRLIVLWTSTN